MRTLQAVRQVLFAALTIPALEYAVNDAAPVTLPDGSVKTIAGWRSAANGGAQPPSPFVTLAVSERPGTMVLAEREMRATIQVSSSTDDDEVTELYEAIRAILHGADSNADGDWLQFAPPDLSRSATATTLGVTIRTCRQMTVSPAEFEDSSARYYLTAVYRIVAV